jgi:hypothetical protein
MLADDGKETSNIQLAVPRVQVASVMKAAA